MENQKPSKEEKPVQINFIQQLPKEEPVNQDIEPEIVPEPAKVEEVIQPEQQVKPTRNNVTVIDRLFPF